MKQISFIIVCSVITILTACQQSSNSEAIPAITMLTSDKKFNSDSYLGSYHIIKLDCPTTESVVSGMTSLLWADGQLVVIDTKSNKLLLFEADGSFIKSTQNMIGHGPNEYVSLSDATIDTGSRRIYALSRFPGKLQVFDYKLNLLNTYGLADISASEIVTDGEFLYYLQQNEEQTQYELLCQPLAHLDQSPQKIHSFDLPAGQLFTFGHSMTKSDVCRMAATFNDTIYKLESGKLIPDFTVDFGDDWYSSEEKMSINDFQRLNFDKYWAIKNISVSDSTIIFSTNKMGTYIIDREKGTGTSNFGFYNKRVPFLSGFTIPIEGRPKSIVYDIMSPAVESFKKQLQNDGLRAEIGKDIEQAVMNFDETGNPLLIIWDQK